ncbi:hypothetical protein K438DRAFT_1760524 [Mycena galopus ATCC 62051]|nr:hypothetical protein K438DRAFT_1760524 [Mycena galopus ATCC 62051]
MSPLDISTYYDRNLIGLVRVQTRGEPTEQSVDNKDSLDAEVERQRHKLETNKDTFNFSNAHVPVESVVGISLEDIRDLAAATGGHPVTNHWICYELPFTGWNFAMEGLEILRKVHGINPRILQQIPKTFIHRIPHWTVLQKPLPRPPEQNL